MEEQDVHGLNLSLTLKSPPNHHHHLNAPLPSPPPPPPPPPSQCRSFELLQMFPYILTRARNNLYDLLPPGHSLRHPPTNYKSPSDDEMDKEIVASIEEKRRKAAEEMEEREWERRQERKLQRRREVEEEVVAVSSPNSTVSTASLSGNKRGEREENSEAEKDLSSEYIVISEDEEGGEAAASVAARKKLMLSKDKAAVLEETFKEHNWLSTKQKVELGKQLDLRPRQVEVWFQNRRARTKLKQTEVNYDYLKTCCEVMGEENRRLKKELNELRAFKHSHQSNMDMFPPTTFVTCPQCTRVTTPSSSSSTQASSVAGATNTNHQKPADPNHPKKSTSGIPFAKLISSEALNVPRRLP